MSQSRKHSMIESVTNTFVGFIITVLVAPAIYWICDVEVNVGQITATTALFTILSIVRGYALRRVFNNIDIDGIYRRVKERVFRKSKGRPKEH